jgi:hypothetical protein
MGLLFPSLSLSNDYWQEKNKAVTTSLYVFIARCLVMHRGKFTFILPSMCAQKNHHIDERSNQGLIGCLSNDVTPYHISSNRDVLTFTKLLVPIGSLLLSSWNLKLHYHVHKSPPLDPILSQPNPVQSVNPNLPKVHLYVFLPSLPWSSP